MTRREFIHTSAWATLAFAGASRFHHSAPAVASEKNLMATFTPPAWRLEDLGEPAHGDVYMAWRYARHPQSGAALALGALSKNGFVVVDPAAQTAFQVLPPEPLDVGWAIGQAPSGEVYQTCPNGQLHVWDWTGRRSRIATALPRGYYFTLDVAADGRVYLPSYNGNHMFRYDPQSGQVEDLGDYNAFGRHIRNVYCGRDGLVYVSSTTYGGERAHHSVVVAFDPRTDEKKVVDGLDESTISRTYCGITQDAEGRVLVTAGHGATLRQHEIVDARVEPEPRPQGKNIAGAKLVFADGAYLKGIAGSTDVRIGGPAGKEQTIHVETEGAPLRLFSLEAGGGRIWLGTIIPLTLWSYDPATKQSTHYGNPTPVGGEIYSMAFAHGKLYLASYPEAAITRLDPARPRGEGDVLQLGRIKSSGLALHRPYGRTTDENGHVFFAALGGYGCEDSGVARIDAATDAMVSWIYPDTTFGALVYCRASGELLVSERRKGEHATRLTLLAPQDGRVLWSQPVFKDKKGKGGGVISWLDSGGDWVYGLHAHTATLFAFSLSEKKIVARQRELRVGEHNYNALIAGHDGRVWGATDQGLYAASRDLKDVEMIALLEQPGRTFYRFGLAYGDDGALYFANDTRLMRMVEKGE
jgi:streptogramin lyase